MHLKSVVCKVAFFVCMCYSTTMPSNAMCIACFYLSDLIASGRIEINHGLTSAAPFLLTWIDFNPKMDK